MRTYRVTFGIKVPIFPNAATFVFRKVPADVCDEFQKALYHLQSFMPSEVARRIVWRKELDVK